MCCSYMCALAKTCEQILEKEQDFPLHPVNHSFKWLNAPILHPKPAGLNLQDESPIINTAHQVWSMCPVKELAW